MNQFLFFFTMFLLANTTYADSSDTIISPYRIEERYLSGLDIPIKELKQFPERTYFQTRIYNGSDLSVYVLASETALNVNTNFPIDEFVYYLNGRADISLTNGEAYSFHKGDYICVPKGYAGEWTNNGGNDYHLELSVISKDRSDSTKAPTAEAPFLLDQDLIDGIGITKVSDGFYRDVLYTGPEIQISTESEIAGEKEINQQEKEQFIHVLNGLVTLTPDGGTAQTFYAGDFFVLPIGFSGQWKSEGNQLFRSLIVEAVE